jgi:hypothetical protein
MTIENVTIDLDEYGPCECPWCMHVAATGEYPDIADSLCNRQTLSDWHDHAHGLTLWSGCPHEPCNLLSLEYRSTP